MWFFECSYRELLVWAFQSLVVLGFSACGGAAFESSMDVCASGVLFRWFLCRILVGVPWRSKVGLILCPFFWPEKWLQKFEARLFGFTFLDADLCPDSGRKNGTTAVGPRVVPFAYSCPASLKPAGSQVSGLRVLFWPGIILCSLIHWSDLCFEASRGRTGICHSIFGFRSFVSLLFLVCSNGR